MALSPRLIVRLPAPALRGEGAIPVRVDANWLDPVRFVATSGALASFVPGATYAGLTLAAGDSFLYQPTTAGNVSTPGVANGIYVIQAAGAPVRRTDADTGAEILHAAVLVLAGNPGAGQTWIDINSTAPVIGTDTITFRPISAAAGGGGTNPDRFQFETRVEAAAFSIAAARTVIETEAFATVGDGGAARYKKVGSAPSHAGKFQSADGAWWEIDEPELDPRMFGVVNSTTVDQAAKLQDWLTCCGTQDVAPVVKKPLECKIDSAISFVPNNAISTDNKGRRVDMAQLVLRPSFNGGIAIGPTDRSWTNAEIKCPSVMRLGTITWGADSDASMLGNEAGLILRNIQRCRIDYPLQCYGFTIGVACHSENAAFAYNTIRGGHMASNRYNEVVRAVLGSVIPGGEFCNENSWWGGRRGQQSDTNTLGDAYGTVIIAGPGAYTGQNMNRWYSPCYEMAAPAGATFRVPVYLNGTGSRCLWQWSRHESGKGPFGIAKGANVILNRIVVGLEIPASGTGLNAGWLQVNGARANFREDPTHRDPQWSISSLSRHLSSGGPAANPRVAAPFFFRRGTSATNMRESTSSTDSLSNFYGLQISNSVAACIELDTRTCKQWTFHRSCHGSLYGRMFFQAISSAGAILTGSATDSWGTEQYVKIQIVGVVETTSFGGGYTLGGDTLQPVTVTLRSEVERLIVGWNGGSNPHVLKGVEIVAHGSPSSPFGTLSDGWNTIGIHAPLTDAGLNRLATANPATAGIHGCYSAGEVVGNKSAVTGGTQPSGWVCTTAGWLAAAWVASTAYAALGQIVTNDSGKMYTLVTAGTSASSGGPTGTGTAIADNTCVWDYIGVKAVFAALANVP